MIRFERSIDRRGYRALALLLLSAVLGSLPLQSARAAFPGTSGNIAFASNRDGNHEIYVMTQAGALQTRLTFNAAEDVEPAWSPDGTKIVFASTRDGNGEIYVMSADGSNVIRLTKNQDDETHPTWQPVPEPCTLAGLAIGLGGLGWIARRRSKCSRS